MVDVVIFGLAEELEALLIKRLPKEEAEEDEPFPDHWALPGGHVEIHETVELAAERELFEETHAHDVFMEQLHTFSGPDRDPREPTISTAFYALVRPETLTLKAGSDAKETRWFSMQRLPAKLAFDHADILAKALERLRSRIRHQPIGFELLPKKFTLGQLQGVYEKILGQSLDKRNFRRDFLRMGILDEMPGRYEQVSYRPPKLYRFNKRTYDSLKKTGFNFQI